MKAIETTNNEIIPYKMITSITENCFFYNVNGRLYQCSIDEKNKFIQWLTNQSNK
jgi:hypothetical protein